MNAGLMDRLISLQSYTESTDANTGEKLQTFAAYSAPWARVEDQESGSEQVNADRREHKQVVFFTIRYDSAVTVRDRVVYNSLNFNIVNMANLQRGLYLKIQTELTE